MELEKLLFDKEKNVALGIKILASTFCRSCSLGSWNQEDDSSFIMKLELNFKAMFLRNCGCICVKELREWEQGWWRDSFFPPQCIFLHILNFILYAYKPIQIIE